MDPIFEKNLLTTKDAGELSGYTSDYLARLARSGKVVGKRIGHSWLIEKESLEQFLDKQENQKTDHARTLARARVIEYRKRHSFLHDAERKLSTPLTVPPVSAGIRSFFSQAIALGAAFLVVASGAYIAQAAPLSSLASNAMTIARMTAFGFESTFGDTPARIAAKINSVSAGVLAYAPRVAEDNKRSSARIASSLLAHPDLSPLRMKISGNVPMNNFNNSVALVSEPTNASTVTVEEMQSSALAAYEFVATPSRVANSLTTAYTAVGNDAYSDIIASFSGYRALVQRSGESSLSLAARARDALAASPDFISRMNLAIGYTIIAGTHAAIDADTAAAYDLATTLPESGRTVIALTLTTGDVLAEITSRAPALATTAYLQATAAPATLAPALAQVVFGTEYAGATRFVAAADTVSNGYLGTVMTAGTFAYEGAQNTRSAALALRSFSEGAPAALEDAYLGTLGESALALHNFSTAKFSSLVRVPQVAAAIAATAPALSVGEQMALITYTALNTIFSSTGRALATLVGPPPSIVLPSAMPKTRTIITPSPIASRVANANYPNYTTVVQGVSENFVNQSLASLRGDILATVAGMIHPVVVQGGTNVTTIQQVNMIQDLSDLIVRNGDFRGGTFDGGIVSNASSVAAAQGTFGNLTASTTSLATTTVTGDLTLTGNESISGSLTLTSSFGTNGSVTANSFAATSTSATSTFSGSLNVGNGGLVYATSTRDVGIGVLSPAALLAIENSTSTQPIFVASNAAGTEVYRITDAGFVGIGTTSPTYALSVEGSSSLGNQAIAGYFTATTTADNTFPNLIATNSTSTNSTSTNLYSSSLVAGNATSTNLYASSGVIDNATSTSLFASLAHFTSGILDSFTATLATITGLNVTNSTTTNATTTNFYATNGVIDSLASAFSTITNLIATTITGTDATFTNSTTTNATTTGSFALTSATPARLLSVAMNGVATSTDLSSWLSGTANQITMTDNGLGGLTASLPSLLSITNASSSALSTNNLWIGGNATTTANGNFSTNGSGTFNSNLSVIGNTTIANATSTNLFASGALSALGSLALGTVSTTTIAGDGNASTIYGPLTVRGTPTQAGSLTIQRGLNNTNNTLSFNDQTGVALLQIYTDANTGYGRIVGDQSFLTLGTTVGGTALSIDTIHNVNATANIVPTANAVYSLGSPSYFWNHAYLNDVVANNISAASSSIAGTNSQSFTINAQNPTTDAQDESLIFYRGSGVVPNAVLAWDSTNKRFSFNQNTYISNLDGTTASTTFTVAATAEQTGNLSNWLDSSGGTLAALGVNGSFGLGTSTPSAQLSVAGVAGGTTNLFAISTSTALFATSTALTVDNNGNLSLLNGANFSVSGNFTVSGTTSFTGSATFPIAKGNFLVGSDAGLAQATSSVFVSSVGNFGVGTAAPSYKLDVAGSGHFTGLVDAANFVATSSSATSTFAGGFSVGLCVTSDTRLRRRRKKRGATGDDDDDYDYDECRIDEIKAGDEIQSFDEKTGHIVYRRVKQLAFMGVKQTYRLATEDGRVIRTTANHPYLVARSGRAGIGQASWKKTSAIREGDRIAVPKPRLGVFVDDANMFYAKRKAGVTIEYARLARELSACFDLRFINYHIAVPEECDTGAYEKTQAFIAKLPAIVTICRKPLKYITIRGADGARAIKKKGDVDMEIAVDVWRNFDALDAVLVLAGDSDYAILREEVLHHGKKIAFASFNQTVSREIRSCGKYLALEKVFGRRNEKQHPDLAAGGLLQGLWYPTGSAVSSDEGKDVDNGVLWSRVRSIEPVAEEDVYDIEVEGTHNFIGNDIVAHNTAFVVNQAAPAGSLYVNPSGNVGVGTASPNYKLEVNGTASSTSLVLGNALAVAYGGTGQTSFTSGNLLYGAGNGAVQNVATSTISVGSGISVTSGTLGYQVGGSNVALGIASNALSLSMLPQLSAGYILGNNTGSTANVTSFATSTLFGAGTGGQVLAWNNGVPQWVASTTLANISGMLAISNGGMGTSTAPTYGKVLLGDANGNWEYSATSTLGIIGMSVGNTVTGGTPGSVLFVDASGNLGQNNANFNWNNTTNLLNIVGNASTTQFTASGNMWLTNLGTPAGAFLAVDANGKVIATSTPTGSGTLIGTTGQLAYFSGTNTAVGTSSIFLAPSGNVGIGTTALNAIKFAVGFANASVEDAFADLGRIATLSDVVETPGGGISLLPAVCGNYTVTGLDGLSYSTVVGEDGKCWFASNLGTAHVATAYNDSASYGDLYQWGRLKDGHQIVTSPTTSTLSNTDNPGTSSFILSPSSPYDWRSPQNDNLWGDANRTNNVCPAGWHVPSQAEWSAWATAAGVNSCGSGCLQAMYNTNLKLPAAGYRDGGNGSLYSQGSYGLYWSSSVSGTNASNVYFSSSAVDPSNPHSRASGFSARCVQGL